MIVSELYGRDTCLPEDVGVGRAGDVTRLPAVSVQLCVHHCGRDATRRAVRLRACRSPVCASDGKTYGNACEMKLEACQRQIILHQRPLDHCHGTYVVYTSFVVVGPAPVIDVSRRDVNKLLL